MKDQKRDLTPHRMQETVLQLLERVCGSSAAAELRLRAALVHAGLAVVPAVPDEALSFVRAHLLGALSTEAGPRLAMAFIDDLSDALEPAPQSGTVASEPASSKHRVTGFCVRSPGRAAKGLLLLVDPNAFRRASLARALVQGLWDVQTASTTEEVISAVGGEDDRPDAVVVELDHPATEMIVRRVVEQLPKAAVVLRGEPTPQLAGLCNWARVRACPRDASVLDVLDALMKDPWNP